MSKSRNLLVRVVWGTRPRARETRHALSAASDDQYRIVHKTIKKVSDDLDRHAFNTVISALMIGVNELLETKAQNASLLQPLAILASPVAPHLAEELWQLSGGADSVLDQAWPTAEERWLIADELTYPVSLNGKVRLSLIHI